MTKIGIVSALRSEAACLTDGKPLVAEPHYLSEQLVLVLSGMGKDRVSKAVDSLIALGVDGLISFGTAGALNSSIKSGDVIVAENIIDASGRTQAVSTGWRDKAIQQLADCPAIIHGGNIATTECAIASTANKLAVHEKTRAIGVDMESALIINAAYEHKLSALSIRIIVDEANMSIPNAILANTDAFGELAIKTLPGSILLHPTLIVDLIRLGLAFNSARHSMRWIGSHAEQVLLPD